jgi:hypothetical protein
MYHIFNIGFFIQNSQPGPPAEGLFSVRVGVLSNIPTKPIVLPKMMSGTRIIMGTNAQSTVRKPIVLQETPVIGYYRVDVGGQVQVERDWKVGVGRKLYSIAPRVCVYAYYVVCSGVSPGENFTNSNLKTACQPNDTVKPHIHITH